MAIDQSFRRTTSLQSTDAISFDQDNGAGGVRDRKMVMSDFASELFRLAQPVEHRVELGTNEPTDDDSAILIARAVTADSSFSHGIRDETTFNTPTDGAYASFDAIPKVSGATAYNHLHGFQARPNYSGSTSIGAVSGFTHQITHGGSGTIALAHGVKISDALGDGPITNQYGIWIDNLTRGSSNIAIYSQCTGPSYLAGTLQVAGLVSMGTAPRITAAGFTTYGSILSHNTTGDFLSNPNLTIINGVLDFKSSSGATIRASYAGQGVSIQTGGSTERLNVSSAGVTRPGADNTQTLGSASYRWSEVFAGTGTINTSDEREKQDVADIDPRVLRAWGRVKFQQFRWRDSVQKKGEGARIHFGVIAQRVKEAFEAEGLDPFAYGLLCYDEWGAQPERWSEPVLDDDGNVVVESALIAPALAAGNRYGVRYEEALALECAYLRARLDGLL